MPVRSIVLFGHLIGLLVVFVGFAFEWLSLSMLGQSRVAEPGSPVAWLRRTLPRIYGVGFALLLVSGVYLARTLGAFGTPWVRLSLALLVLMGIVGAPTVRAHASAPEGPTLPEASLARLRASLATRTALGLTAVLVMIDKPTMAVSLLLAGGAIATALTFSVLASTLVRGGRDIAGSN
jgi:hypothetical protein